MVVVALLSLPSQARANPLTDAKRAYASGDVDACRTAAQAALEAPAPREERVETYRLLGLCLAALGETDAARDAFAALLAHDDDARLAPGEPAELRAPYDEARATLAARGPTALVLEEEIVEGDFLLWQIRVDDPLGLIAKVVFELDDQERGPALAAASRMELEKPYGATRLLGLDRQGGVVTELALEAPAPLPEDPERTLAPAEPALVEADPPDDEGLPLAWVGIGAGVAVVVVAGLAATAGAVAYAMTPPDEVTLQGSVAFGGP